MTVSQHPDVKRALDAISVANEARVRAARMDVNDFIEYVAVPREHYHPDGSRVRPWDRLVQTPFHERLQAIWGAHRFSAVMAFPGSGKTTQALHRCLWMLGHDPDLCMAVVSQDQKAEGLAAKVARTMRLTIERSADLIAVFPHLRPGPVWQDTAWIVQRNHWSGEMTCQIVGQGKTPTGQRLDLVLVDDLITWANTRDDKDRRLVSRWFRRNILDRLGPRGQVIFLCNAQHPHDLFHQWERDPHSAFKCFRFPVLNDVGEPTVPEIWPIERINVQRAAMSEDGSSVEFDKAFLCIARDDEESIFHHDHVVASFTETVEPVFEVDSRTLPDGAFVVVAVDPAARKKKTANFTAFTVGMYWPSDGTRQLLWVKAARLRSPEIAEILVDLEVRYRPVFHMVENNAAQDWLVDIVEQWVQIQTLEATARGETPTFPRPRIFPYHTGIQKQDPYQGLDGLSAEISGRRWVFPSSNVPSACHADLSQLRSDILYCRRAGHTPDRLMSLWLLREGFRHELSRRARAARMDEGDSDEPVATRLVSVSSRCPRCQAPVVESGSRTVCTGCGCVVGALIW